MLWTDPDSIHAGLATTVEHVEATDQIFEVFVGFVDYWSRERGRLSLVSEKVGIERHGGENKARDGGRRGTTFL